MRPERTTQPHAMTSADLTLLQTKRALLVSGLFDPAFYRATYADLRASPRGPGATGNPAAWPIFR